MFNNIFAAVMFLSAIAMFIGSSWLNRKSSKNLKEAQLALMEAKIDLKKSQDVLDEANRIRAEIDKTIEAYKK